MKSIDPTPSTLPQMAAADAAGGIGFCVRFMPAFLLLRFQRRVLNDGDEK